MQQIIKTLFLCLCFVNLLISQEAISFRNTLNEGNYWFYEGKFDSAIVYYNKAEKFNLQFYPEELHLFSRCLWEIGEKKKSIEVLKFGGIKDYFLRDTTYYNGLGMSERIDIAKRLTRDEEDLYRKGDFYDSLHKKDQMYRKILFQYPQHSRAFDSIVKLMEYQDSLNFVALLNEIKLNGYTGGHVMAPVGPGAILIHAGSKLLLNSYSVFQKELEAGRMSHYDFSRAIDRFFVSNGNQTPYNSYYPLEETEVASPILVFVNRCLIGMSPYYDVYIPRLYRRGMTPPRSKLYDYYKKSKQNFNCIRIR